MRGKGLVIFFSIALILICIYQLSFNVVTSKVEQKATDVAKAQVLKGASEQNLNDSTVYAIRLARQHYLDSVSNLTVFNLGIASYTYQDCKDQQLNLGLDLQGGMNVVLQVGMDNLVKALADNNNDPAFIKALELTSKKSVAQPQADYATLFEQSWNEVAPNDKLARIFATRNNQDEIKLTSTNDEVTSFIRKEATGAFDRTFNILRSRIDKFGVTQPNITAQASSGRIVVELPGVDNPARVRKLLQASAVLEFWETYDNQAFAQYIFNADQILKRHLSVTDTAKKNAAPQANPLISASENNPNPLLSTNDSASAPDTAAIAKADTGNSTLDNASQAATNQEEAEKENPLRSILQIPYFVDKDNSQKARPGPAVGWSRGVDTARVDRYLAMDFVRAAFPRDVKFLWSSKPFDQKANIYELYAIKKQVGTDRAPLEGDKVISARQDVDPTGKQEVSMTMNPEGTKIWKNLTAKQIGMWGKYPDGTDHNGYIAIVLDNYVYSAPTVINEIPNGRSSISGSFTVDEAKDLANILQAGKLPAPAKIIAEDVVGPSLGQESITAGIRSILIAFLAVIAFMVLYYNTSGVIADIALLFNLFFIIGVLASLGATLTLSGIAGIVLTMGMAVDANVLIHERIKEEWRAGKGLVRAVHDGHVKSYSAVFDTHLTTLITGIILAYFGLGPVLGYATTLNIGVLLTLFTAVFMAHVIFDWWMKKGWDIKFTTFISHNNFSNMNIQFVNKRKYAYIFSGTLAIIGIISIVVKGFDYGVDFSGGRSYVVQFPKAVTTEQVKADLEKVYGVAPEVKTYGTSDKMKITTGYQVSETSSHMDSLVDVKLYNGLKQYYPSDVDYPKFVSKYQLSSQVVGPSISNDILSSAYKAIIFSLIGIFIYILVRFRKWQFALGAIIALAHDVLIVMGAYSLLAGIVPFTLEVDESFVAAALTVMGYSVADTVIVFDRIREFLREHPMGDMKITVNDAINKTLNRTVITSGTVLLVLLILFLFGGDVIRGFSFALLLGVSFGTYSSIFVATPIVIDLANITGKKTIEIDPVKKKPVPAK